MIFTTNNFASHRLHPIKKRNLKKKHLLKYHVARRAKIKKFIDTINAKLLSVPVPRLIRKLPFKVDQI